MIFFDRETLAQLIIIVAVSVGGWMMLVDPVTSEIKELELQIEEHELSEQGMNDASLQAVVGRVAKVRKRMDEIERCHELAEDSTALYAQLMELANGLEVRVQRLQPREDTRPTGVQGISVQRVDLTVEGRYEGVARFLDAIEKVRGFVRPASLRVTPFESQEGQLVVAQATYEVLQFTIDEVLTHVEGMIDAEG
jgi:Tfp pilus assembly protein PilO